MTSKRAIRSFSTPGTTDFSLSAGFETQGKSAFISLFCTVALEVSSAGYDLILLGGNGQKTKSLALMGRETRWMLDDYRADKYFLGSSVSLEKVQTHSESGGGPGQGGQLCASL